MAYTSQTAVRKPVARLFVLPTVMTDTQANAAITSGKCPSAGWVQLKTADGGVVYSQDRQTSDLVTQQTGVEDVVIDQEPATLTITLAAAGLAELINLMIVNSASTGDALSGVGLRENRGDSLIDTALSFFVYNKSYDSTNETNTPVPSADPEALLVFKAVPNSASRVEWNNVQNTATISFRCLTSTSTGSARGFYGRSGAFTAGA